MRGISYAKVSRALADCSFEVRRIAFAEYKVNRYDSFYFAE